MKNAKCILLYVLLVLVLITGAAVMLKKTKVSEQLSSKPVFLQDISGATKFTLDPKGNVYTIANGGLVKYSNKGRKLADIQLKDGPFAADSAWKGSFAVDNSGNVYILQYDTKEVFVFDSNSRLKSRFIVDFPLKSGNDVTDIKVYGKYIYFSSEKNGEAGTTYIMQIDTETRQVKEIATGWLELHNFDVDEEGFLYYTCIQNDGKRDMYIIKYDLNTGKEAGRYKLDHEYRIERNCFAYSRKSNSVYFYDSALLEIKKFSFANNEATFFAGPVFGNSNIITDKIKLDVGEFMYLASTSEGNQLLVYDTNCSYTRSYTSKLVICYGNFSGFDTAIAPLRVMFSRLHPDVELVYQNISVDIKNDNYIAEFQKQLNLKLYSGDNVDIILLPGELLPLYAVKGAVADLDRMIRERGAGYGSNAVNKNFLRVCTINNKVYALPYRSVLRKVNYIKSVFEEKGITPPDNTWNWDDFINLGSLYKNADDKYIVNEIRDGDFLINIINSHSRDFVDINNMESCFNSTEFREILQKAKNIYDREFVYKWRESSNAQELFKNSKNLLFLENNLYYAEMIQKHSDNYAFGDSVSVNFPTWNGRSSVCPNMMLMTINSKSQQKELAYEFMSLLYSDEFLFNYMGGLEHLSLGQTVIIDDYWERNKDYIKRTSPDKYKDKIEALEKRLDISNARKYYDMLDTMGSLKAHNILLINPEFRRVVIEQGAKYFSGEIQVEEACSVIYQKAQFLLTEMK